MQTIQATMYGAKTLLHMLLGHVPVIQDKSTVNERLDILGNAKPVAGELFRLGVLVAGNKGHIYEPGVEGIPLISPEIHVATNASLYGPMPLCLRPLDDDLPAADRAKYALRKVVPINNVNYYGYYGLRLNILPTDVNIVTKKVTIENGVRTEAIFNPDTADLYPTPPVLPSSGAITTTGEWITVNAVITVKLDAQAVEEYINVAKIMYGGDERYGVMSEFGLCTGADRTITTDSTAGQVNFLESIGTQIYSFATEHKALYYNSQELTLNFELGNSVPLLGTSSIPTLQTVGA